MSRFRWLTLLFILGAAIVGCRVTDLELWRPTTPASPDACSVSILREISYAEPGTNPHSHSLDLFVPRDRTNCPVVVLVHGGAWMWGDNRSCGLVSSVGEFLASQGIVVVAPNYRLWPDAKHPEHVRDVARAFAWAHEHAAEYGGRPDQMFLVGHSAGGHLATLLSTDERFLNAVGLKLTDVQGTVSISGVYQISPGDYPVALGEDSSRTFSIDQMLPVRGEGGWGLRWLGLSGVPIRLNVFGPVFGNDPQVQADASPINHVRAGLPPMVLLSAEHDLPGLPRMAEEFHAAMVEQGNDCEWMTIKGRNHNSICFRAIDRDDPAARAILDFVHKRTLDGDHRSER